ncbi:citrate/2-methylcitrate synthase [Bacillus sp. DX4.1]|uniref:citrate/2-methylcitrate synthase n=1 Tax=Bacillus sp. DX4.1 TaxID=3055867 RepID=UPI0025A00140|nr:citrate/2-methylcitrate synthase [Bacillus sp. DX4.1]MDM5189148.1 citrate/2-methylcitrate synthase [Bacillus sp. DX4.1]
MSVLRTAVSSIGQSNFNESLHMNQVISIIAKLPTIISYRYRKLNEEAPIEPDPILSHTANYLYMLKGHIPSKIEIRALEAYFILTQDHGINPSTFTGRIVSSTRSDLISSITAAIGALKGPLHGGASSKITEMLESIGDKQNVEAWVRKAMENGERLMGFGHRSYKTTDPRSIALRSIAIELSKDSKWMDLAVYVEKLVIDLLKEYKPNRKLYTNVEFYTAAVMKAIGFSTDLYTPTFAISRVIGWCAHITEAAEERLIYPRSVYKGRLNRL